MRLFLTGSAGFIGYHTAKRLLSEGHTVHGYDSINDYYDPKYKHARLDELRSMGNFSFTQGLLEDNEALTKAYMDFDPDHVLNLAAQAGVRYSIENPMAYVASNLIGFQHVIELVRHQKPTNFVYASSSSVYGGNKIMPFTEDQDCSDPISLYAASKLANELVACSYGHIYKLPSTGLRFFTVYGPMSRPDMAMFKFAELMRKGEEIPVFNEGKMIRDWTYIDDIVSGIIGSLNNPHVGQVYNLGKGSPDQLGDMIDMLEEFLGIKAKRNLMGMQAGDVTATHAGIDKARKLIGYEPKTSLKEGMKAFCDWYRDFVMNK